MSNIDALILQHSEEVDQIVNRYISKFQNSEGDKTKETLAAFVVENFKDLSAEIANSAMNPLVHADAKVTEENLNAVRGINMQGGAKWQQEIIRLFAKMD